MRPTRPPFALEPITFRFAAVAAAAGRAALGGPRESVLAAYLVARLADDSLRGELDPEAWKTRADAARHWAGSMALPAEVRAAALAAVPADGPTGATLRRVISVTAKYMDAAARGALERLADALDAQPVAR